MLKEIGDLEFKDKKQLYNFMKMRLTALIGEEKDWLANLVKVRKPMNELVTTIK